MKYIAGIDGGASKTHCAIGDTADNILSEGFAAGSSHHLFGLEAAGDAIADALREALEKLGIRARDLGYTVLGLAGADLDPDYVVLGELCGGIFPAGRFKVLNDTWIGLRAGIPENRGIVTVCGTGGACAGRNRRGEEVRLRNLGYRIGNRGGGADITNMALHYAFRSDEKTGRKTALEEELPRALGLSGLDGIIELAASGKVAPGDIYGIPVLVGKLAAEGDAVCQDILVTIGHELGEIAGGVARRLDMEREHLKVTLVGSVFKSECPLLFDEYITTIHRTAPFAKVTVADEPPAYGAYYLACDEYKKTE